MLPYISSNKYVFLLLVLLGSLVPDLDSPKSKLSNKIPIIPQIISVFAQHRGLFHSIWFPLILFITHLYFLESIILLAISIGYTSHLIIDSLTKQGINFLHPIADLKLSGFVETGTFLETIILIIIVGLDVLLITNVL
jgi:inner membrane protein